MYKGAIVGCGAVACQAHVPAWQATPGFQIVAAVDPIPAQHAQVQALLPAVRCYDHLDTLLAHEDVDFLDICTPPALHEASVLQACARGVHVLCEKPVTCTTDSMQRIMAAVAAANILVFAMHNWKYAPSIQALKRLLLDGVIGTPTAVECTTLRTKPAGETGWRLDPAMAGGGILLDHGWHAFYLLLFLLDAAPQRIAATVERRLYLATGVEDTVTCDVQFPQATAKIHLTWAAAERMNRIVIHGAGGTLRLEDAHLHIALHGQAPPRCGVSSRPVGRLIPPGLVCRHAARFLCGAGRPDTMVAESTRSRNVLTPNHARLSFCGSAGTNAGLHDRMRARQRVSAYFRRPVQDPSASPRPLSTS